MTIYNVIELLGGLAMFLYGMSFMGEKLEKLVGGRLEKIFEKLTSNRFKGLALGIIVTAIVQSSSSTTVMLVGFVNSGIMRLSQAVSIIMGANIGTTVTAWILNLSGIEGDSFLLNLCKPTTFAPIFAIVGVVMRMVAKNGKKKDVGGILVGFALLMIGMNTMSTAVEPLSESERFQEIMTMFNNPIIGVLVGALVTAVVQSSAASIGMLQALSNKGMITFGMAFPIILGQNIGTCVTALLSSIGANKNAKRVAVVHLYFNVVGTAIAFIVYYAADAVFDFAFADGEVTSFKIAVIHTLFNLGATLVLLPFNNLLEKLAILTVRDEPRQEDEAPVLLDERLLGTPGVALEQCRNVTSKMAILAKDTICRSIDLIKIYDEDMAATVFTNEDIVDKYEDMTGTYLVRLSGRSLTMEDSRCVTRLLYAIGDFECISDHAVNITETAKEIRDKEVVFSSAAKKELEVLFSAVEDILDVTIKAFESNSTELAKQVEPLEEVVDHLRTEMKARHIERLRDKICVIELGFIFTDLLTDLERVSDHCSNIAVSIIRINENCLDNHQYLDSLKSSNNEEFTRLYNEYSKKYALLEARK